MNDTITLPRSIFEQIEQVLRRLVAKVEPTDNDAKDARNQAVQLMQVVTAIADDEGMQQTHAVVAARKTRRSGIQVLLELAEKAEREGWEGPSDLAENHDTYAAEAAEEDLKRIHDYYH
jgi:hypothetical protein